MSPNRTLTLLQDADGRVTFGRSDGSAVHQAVPPPKPASREPGPLAPGPDQVWHDCAGHLPKGSRPGGVQVAG